MSRMLEELKQSVIDAIADYNAEVGKNDLSASKRAEDAVKAAEKDYAKQSQDEIFSQCREKDNPIAEAITVLTYPVLKHRILKENGVITGMELVEGEVKNIDLVKLCDYCRIPSAWKYKAEKMGELLALRAARELGLSTEEICAISKTYRMDKLARSEEMGATPTSNTQVCKLLQQVIDAVYFVDDGKGKNVYAANSHDVTFMLKCFTKHGRKALHVGLGDPKLVLSLVPEIMHRIITGGKYGVEYKQLSERQLAKISEDEAKAKKDSAPKPKSNTPKKSTKLKTIKEKKDEPVKVPRQKKSKSSKVSDPDTLPDVMQMTPEQAEQKAAS